ncbi:unnamed protein product [Orchesella dallaii]|uniref:Uncharacterized protein n=1 Tax=Orchesella dallaii TaxID=48710 RepID=A0ABP1QZW8_9HEXA
MNEHKLNKRDAYGYGGYTPPAYPPPTASYSAPATVYVSGAPPHSYSHHHKRAPRPEGLAYYARNCHVFGRPYHSPKNEPYR